MSFYHVFGEVGEAEEVLIHRRTLFIDLTHSELVKCFIKPYEKGNDFISKSNEIISIKNLRSVEIICTKNSCEIEKNALRIKEREELDQLYGPGHDYVYPNIGDTTYRDLFNVGENVNKLYIKGHPGFKAGRWELLKKVMIWFGGIAGPVVVAGMVKWLGWL
ncbi:hypothetical protein LOS15_06270 [Halomonas sp. 7T]|uniref:hypothetical protein n=1 Tax=Halomonas sp. 7T TaxID=2893469 RepID=UPI0021DA0CB1|nr:hypothetical protein [Halomonas sp. 7T]UXZ55628.1 hypothetical protein LOS15_06270 [Halomonas sp. 7T]